jgi:hypothetical protein
VTRHCHFSGLGCAFWLFALAVLAVAYAVMAAAWVLWACVILPAAGVAWLLGYRDAARALGELVFWDLKVLRE